MKHLESLVWRCIWPSWLDNEDHAAMTWIARHPPGAVTLFSRHLPDLQESLALNNRILQASNGATRIAIDQEGGPVQRLPAPFPDFPPADSWQKVDSDLGICLEHVRQHYRNLGLMLLKFGFSINFAPVCDIEFFENHAALKHRCFSADPERCAQLVASAIAGLQQSGINSCAKHFPGHGAVKLDSHLELDTFERTKADFKTMESQPFKAAFRQGVPIVMAAHFNWPDLDVTQPTTFSPALVSLLRDEMKFEGIILTDDLEMGAISKHWSREEAALLALSAGYDAVLYCKSYEMAAAAAEITIREAEASQALREMLKSAAARINKLSQVTPSQLVPPESIPEILAQADWPQT